MDHKRSHRILRTGQAGCLILLTVSYLLSRDADLEGPALALCILGAAMFFGALIQALFFYRCPNCGFHFDIRSRRPEYCSGCGKRIQWEPI